MPTELTPQDYLWLALLCGMGGGSVFLGIYFGYATMRYRLTGLERRVDRVLNHQLMLDISPALAIGVVFGFMILVGAVTAIALESVVGFVPGALLAMFFPYTYIRVMERKRLKQLETQIVDGVMSLASGVRAGLNLVQSFKLLVQNSTGPIKQEMGQLMREYDLGIDLQQAMHNSSNRIGSSYYRLLFTAIEAHRQRGGDMGESLDRIAESIREIQRLEGKLDAITAQGRAQARFMAVMPIVILFILGAIFPDETRQLFERPEGRLILLTAGTLIVVGFLWIRRIMQVDI